MEEHTESTLPVLKLALEKKILNQKDLDQCRELVKKSKKIGLATSLEEVLIKQNIVSEEQLQELKDVCRLADGGKIFGTYRLGRLLGQGGMGKVYEAVHEIMGRNIAIKVMTTQLTEDKNKISRFYQEIRALAKLSHPNIVTIYDAGKINRRHYFAMEFLSGPSLKEYVDSKKGLSEKEALKIIRATARALGHAHGKSVVHRDVKPENIIFDGNGVPKLTDFGVVMHHDIDHLTLTQEGFLVGSFFYVSPEQVNGSRDIDGRSDIYSLGATLYYALTGRTVYSGKSPQEVLAKHLTGRFVSPRKYNPAVSARTVRLIGKMMAPNRDKRFQTMKDVVASIDATPVLNRVFYIGALALAGVVILFTGMALERVFNFF